MAVILTPDKWRRQPSGPVGVDWSNPITRGLSYAAVNGVEHVSRAPSGMTQVSVSPDGFTERGTIAYRAAADVAACTVIGHVKFTSDNADYAALEWGYFVSDSVCSQLAIGFGNVTGAASGEIYAANRANGAGTTVLEEDVSLPYVAVLAMTGTLGSGASATAYKNGSVLGTVTQSGAAGFATDTRRQFKKFIASSTGKESAWCYKFNRVLSAQEIASLSAFPWQIFRKAGRIYFFPSAAGGATDGSLSKTVDAVTLSATGAVDVAGSLSKSVANVTLSAAGAVDVVGTLAKSLANVTLVSAGTIDLVGTLSANVAAVTLSSAGSVSDGPSGSLSVVLANVGVSATGTVDISGSSSFTVGSVSLSATGGVDVTGTLSATTGSVTLSSAGTVGTTVSEGVLSATIANVSVVSAGTVSVSGTLSSTLADVTLVAYESVVVPPAQTTGGGGSRPILIREKSLRDELSELRKQRMEAALLRQIQREDEEIVLIMAALAA